MRTFIFSYSTRRSYVAALSISAAGNRLFKVSLLVYDLRFAARGDDIADRPDFDAVLLAVLNDGFAVACGCDRHHADPTVEGAQHLLFFDATLCLKPGE